MLPVLLGAVAALLALILALLAVPVELALRVRRVGELRTEGRVRWLFGLVDLPVGGDREPSSEADERSEEGAEEEAGEEEAAERPRRERDRARTPAWRRIRAAVRTPGFPTRVRRLVPDLLKRLQVRELRLRARIGREDPADTGMLWALLGPLSVLLLATGADVRLVPDFQAAVLQVDGRGRIRVVPLRVVLSVLGFLLSPVTLRAGWAALRAGAR